MMRSKTIVVWGKEDTLKSSIEYFLSARKNWKVVSISNVEDPKALLLAVKTTQPDIVIIYQGCHGCPTYLPLQLLQDYPVIKVITISLENNMIEVYSKQKIMIKQASDLIAAIEGGGKTS